MARARNIKPGFFKNEDLAECSPYARLCFAGLWMLADREGRLEDRPKRIKGELFPFEAVEVEPLLLELEKFGFITRYDAGGLRAIQISKFLEHQTPHYSEKQSVINGPNTQESIVDEEPQNTGINQEPTTRSPGLQPPSSLNPDSLNPEYPLAPKGEPSKPRRKRRSPEEILSAHGEEVRRVVQELTPAWPEFHDPAREKPIRLNRALFAERVAKILASHPNANADLLISAGWEYLRREGSDLWWKNPEFFFGPEGPWLAFAKDLLTVQALQVTA